jgi:hypothetical protein
MNKTLIALAAAMALVSASANAVNFTGEAGEHYTNLALGFGTTTPGLAVSANWAHSDNDGDIAGLGLGLNVPLGPILATVGGKALYLNPSDGSEGYALAVGGGLQLPLGSHFTVFGEGYYAPDSLSSGVNDYVEANAGLRWNVIPLLTVDAGYRYIEMAGKDGDKNNVLADGPYIGAALNF